MADETERNHAPISIADVPWTEWADVPRFGLRYRHLSLAALGEDYRIGVAIEELPPGMQTAPAHYHVFEEEHLYVLEGSLTLRLGNTRHTMKSGDYVCFPAGQKAGHCLINETDGVCRYVIIGENDPRDVIVYTDSRKVLVRALGRRALFDLGATRGYWDGEDTGLPAGADVPGNVNDADIGPTPDPKPPISEDDAPLEDTDISPRFGGAIRHLTYAAVGNDRRVGVLIEMPAPGKRLAPLHYHMREEEHALVLEGELTLQLGKETHVMGPGDYVAFPAGRKVGHSFLNSGTSPCRYLMIGGCDPADVCIYPQSDKMAVAALNEHANVFDMKARRRYWDGEA
ncbi:MAG: cupin domain-containing protein [Rhizobium sp.]|nr:cupin domain-containing protein [Rhizobium sp.]